VCTQSRVPAPFRRRPNIDREITVRREPEDFEQNSFAEVGAPTDTLVEHVETEPMHSDMGVDMAGDTDERDLHDGVTYLRRRPKPAVFAAPVVMALWQARVFQAFQPPEERRTA
jgi:hypothetical protein